MTMSSQTAVLAASALAAFACGGPARTASGEKPAGPPVTTAVAETRDIERTLVLTGSLKPRAQVQLVAEVGARLVHVAKDEGARVAAGETLAVLDDTDYRLALERARAARALAEANRAHAVVEQERAQNLLRTGGITDQDHLAARVRLQVADAALAQSRAEAEIAATQHARCEIKAPFAGRVARRLVDPGALLGVGAPLFTLVDDAVLEFRANVPSAEYGRIKVGAAVEVSVDSLARTAVRGRVARVTPLVAERTRSFEVVVELPGRPELVGGLFARATVLLGKVPAAVVVPPLALVRDGERRGEAHAFVVAGGRVERRRVVLGLEQADAVQVVEGLVAGEVVVLDPPTGLVAGGPVSALPRAAAP